MLALDNVIFVDETVADQRLGASRSELKSRGCYWEYIGGGVGTYTVTAPGFSVLGIQVGNTRDQVNAAVAGLEQFDTAPEYILVTPPDPAGFQSSEDVYLLLEFAFSGNTVSQIIYTVVSEW